MSCTNCANGLPCDHGTGMYGMGESDDADLRAMGISMGSPSSERFRLFGDPEKNKNTVDDILTGVTGALVNRQARRDAAAGLYAGTDDGPATVRIFGRDVPVLSVAAGIGVVGLGAYALMRR